MRKVAQLAAMVVITTCWANAQTDQSALQQRLNSQFQLTQMTLDRSNIVSTGTTLRLNKDGLVMYGTSSPMPSSNTYKNGRITQGGGAFGRDILIGMSSPGAQTANQYPHHKFAANDEVWVIKIDIHPTDVTLRLCSNPGDGMLYYGDLKFPFDKGPTPTPGQVIAKIGEVLTSEQPEGQPAGVVETAAGTQATPAAPGALNLPALYANSRNSGDQLQLNADHSFVLQEHGRPYHGTFTEKGATLILNLREANKTAMVTVEGADLIDPSGITWILQRPAQAAPAAQVTPAALKLPALYVNSKNAGDQLKLNADKSFSLQEDGQPYHGTFTEKGDSLELNITETNSTTVVTLQGNSIKDTSGHTWTLR